MRHPVKRLKVSLVWYRWRSAGEAVELSVSGTELQPTIPWPLSAIGGKPDPLAGAEESTRLTQFGLPSRRCGHPRANTRSHLFAPTGSRPASRTEIRSRAGVHLSFPEIPAPLLLPSIR